jgi:sensor domain CHASE-containing protein
MVGLSGMSERDASRRAWICVGAPIAALTAIAAAIATWLVCDFARRENETYVVTSQLFITSALEGRASALRDLTLDYANWDSAYAAITRRWDDAWLAKNYYSSVLDAFVVFRSGQLRYFWTDEALAHRRGALPRDAMATARRIPNLEALAAAPSPNGTTASAVMAFDGNLALLAVAPVTLEDDGARIALARGGDAQDFLLGVKVLDAEDIGALGQALGLSELRFEADANAINGDMIAWPIAAMNGEGPARLVWRNARPGDGSRGMIWPIVAALIALGVGATWAAHALLMRFLPRNA